MHLVHSTNDANYDMKIEDILYKRYINIFTLVKLLSFNNSH